MTAMELELTSFQLILKRTLDIALSTLIILLLAPMLFVTAVIVKLDGPGPVTYKLRRFGPDGKEIAIRRFRTMRAGADNEAIFRQATKSDSRVTKVGSVLRRTSLDELPTLFSVLKGDMSLVGPRPKHLAEYEQYKRVADYVLHAKPGITSTSRISGYSYGSGGEETMSLLYDTDKSYVERWSIWLDLRIIGSTIRRVFLADNEY